MKQQYGYLLYPLWPEAASLPPSFFKEEIVLKGCDSTWRCSKKAVMGLCGVYMKGFAEIGIMFLDIKLV